MANQLEPYLFHSSKPVIHRGAWLIAGAAAGGAGFPVGIIEDGALVVADGLIQAVGQYRNIAKEFGNCHTCEHEDRVLAPALINGHCHLELSYLDIGARIKGLHRYKGNPTIWIRDLLAERAKFSPGTVDADELILRHARQTLHHMTEQGVAFVGDVGNSLASRVIGDEQKTRVCFLLELLGLTKESEAKALARLEDIRHDKSLEIAFTPHAPYSTTPSLLRAIKEQSDRRGHIFSIHVAESEQEVEFLQAGTGVFKEFLVERGAWDGSFAIPGKGSVRYLESLGVIDAKTLCVHGVHLDEEEIEIIAKKNAKVCLCPGSNRFLGVGRAPVTEFLAHGILPALGTDSMASNEMLNMWREMRLLREDHAGLEPDTVFAMATRGSAEAWGIASEMGSLEPGKLPLVLKINCHENMSTAKEVFEYLTTAGETVQVEWLE